ncbi:MAG: hypothetical protein LC744_02185 [Chloroflexi bacterium]|nr:hypothetical protein [Chloroflexota bacterium]
MASVLAALLGACGATGSSQGTPTPNTMPIDLAEVESVLAFVREDPEMDAFLDSMPFNPEPLRTDGDLVHVLLRFEHAVPGEGIWARTCEAAHGEVSGAHFVVNVAEGTVEDISPRWGPDSCIALPG